MASNYSRWYRTGSVTVTKNSKNVVGDGTFWLSALLHAGDTFSLDGVHDYEVDTVTDNTHLTLKTAYLEATQSGAAYSINRNWTASMPAEIASKTSELLGDFIRYIDEEQKTILGKSAYEVAVAKGYTGTEAQWLASLKGKSAYEIAKDNGFSGTQAQWLESLLAGGEWQNQQDQITALQAAVKVITSPNWMLKNFIYSGKNLGEAPTTDQIKAIQNGGFSGIGLGDYWSKDGTTYRIVHFNYYNRLGQGAADASYFYLDPVTGSSRLANWAPATGSKSMPPHVVVEIDQPQDMSGAFLSTEQISAGNTGYLQSHWFTEDRPGILSKVISVFGDSHVLEFWDKATTTYSSAGQPSGNVTYWGRLEVKTAKQQMGTLTPHPADIGKVVGSPWVLYSDYGQFALNRLTNGRFTGLAKGLLRDTAKSSSGTYYQLLRLNAAQASWRNVGFEENTKAVIAYFVVG